jgi:hypothetical protein
MSRRFLHGRRRLVKGPDGKLHEKVLSETDHVKDECKAQAIGPCAPKK